MRYRAQATVAYEAAIARLPEREGTPGSGGDKPIEVNVVFTELPGATRALEKAAELAFGRDVRIRLLVPQVVPYPAPLESPPILMEFNERRLLALTRTLSMDLRVEFHLCRDRAELLLAQLAPRSLVILGGRKRIWPTRETRLARTLARHGHVVVFADTRAGSPQETHA
jgi:hypothetical protein